MAFHRHTWLVILMITCGFLRLQAIIWQNHPVNFNCSMFYHKEGDINLAADVGKWCTLDELKMSYSNAVPFLLAIDEINNDNNLLKDVTLGFTLFNSCQGSKQVLLQALRYTDHQYTPEYCFGGDPNQPPWFDVAGLIVATFSRPSVDFSHISKLTEVPIFTSAEATSDEFSDITRHPTFFRTVSGDSKQVDFMLSFVQALDWVYISVVYTVGPYGENAGKQMSIKAKRLGICIQVFHMVLDSSEKTMNEAVEKLLRHKKARVVVGFFEFGGDHFEAAFKRYGAEKELILLGSDTVYADIQGIFSVRPIRSMNESYYPIIKEYFNKRDPKVLVEDKWLRSIFAQKHNCSWGSSQGAIHCNDVDNTGPIWDFTPSTSYKYNKMYDIVYLYAKAIQKTLLQECKDVSPRDKQALRSCVQGPNIRDNLKYTEHQGAFDIKIDKNGDAFAKWEMYQNQYKFGKLERVLIATYDELQIPKLKLFIEKINWSVFDHMSQQNILIEGENVTTPESVCSKPCKAREYFIQQELLCCWDCRTCHVNEYIVNNEQCVPCPFGFWPDEETATKCVAIQKTYLKFDTWVAFVLTGVTVLGLICTLLTCLFYVMNHAKKIIKATTRELCSMILSGILIAFISVIFYITEPSYVSCMFNRHGFNLAVALIYAPLFVKTNRIYRIFKATQDGMGKAKLIDTTTQVIVSIVLVLIQVGLSITSEILNPTKAVERMPIETQAYLELYCHLELQGLLIPLVYNLIIILLCAIHGFLTRALPENFNESKYIFVSVMTTTFLWVVFIPTYFTTFFAYHKSILLATCLILNSFITLMLLFVPKIYAVYFVSDSKIKFGTTELGTSLTNISAEHSSTFQYTLKKMAKQGVKLEATD